MKLRLYKNLKGHNFASGVDFPIRFEIYDRDFKGTASEIPQMGSIPLTLEFGNSGDRVTEPIKKTSLSFSLIKELGVDYSFFYTSDAKKYKIVVSSGVFNWVGYVAQDSFQEDLIYKGEISITAIDNLSYLDSVDFTLKGWQKLGDIITHCVTDTGVDKPLLYDDDFLISKNIAFKDWIVNVGDLAKSTKLEALESVLSSTGARIEQTNANWRISTLYQRRFPTKISKVDKLYKLNTKELVPAKKQVLVSHDLFTPPVFDKFPSENDYKDVSNTSSVPLWKKYKGVSKTGWTNAAGTIKVVTGISEQTSDVRVSGLPLSEYGEGFSIVCAHKSTNLNSAPSANVTIQKIFNKGNYIELGVDTQVSGAMSTSGGVKFSEYTPTNLQINVVIRMNNGALQRYLTNVGEGAEWRPEFSIYKLVLNNITQSGGIKLQIQLPDLVIGSGDLNDLYIAIYPPFVWENKAALYDYQKKWITYTSLDIKNRLNDVEPYVSDIFKGVGKDRNVNEDIDIAFGQCPSTAKSAFMQYANCFYYSDFSSVQNIGVEQLYKILLNQYLIEQAAPASRYNGKMRPKAITGQSPFTLCYDVYNQTIEATGVSLNIKEWTLSGEFVQIASYQSGDALGFATSYEKSKEGGGKSSSSHGGTPGSSGGGSSEVIDDILSQLSGKVDKGSIVKEIDNRELTDDNIYSSLRSKSEDEKRLPKSDVLSSKDADTPLSESNVYSSVRSLSEDEKRLRKDAEDTAQELIIFLKGLKTGDMCSLDYLYKAIGWAMNKEGDLDANSANLRKSLTVPQIIFDTIKAVGGKFWFTDTHTISKVTQNSSTYLCELDLQPNEHCTWDKDDCLTGILHTTDAEGNFNGFQTVECLVISVENDIATLAPRVEVLPPSVGLVLNRCGNITNVKRQSSVFLSAEMGGTITLVNMNSWTIGRNNIGAATGDLSKLASIISMPELNGMSMLAKNVVLYGKYYQIDDITGDYHPVPNFKGDWGVSVPYSYYDEVTHLGRRFLCIDEKGNTGTEPYKGSAIWLCTVDKGEDGDKWNYCDKWDPAQEYKRGDVVLYGRDTYMYQWYEPSKGYYPDAAEYYPMSIKTIPVRVMNTQGAYVDLAIKTQRNRVWALMSKGGLDGEAAFSKQYSPDKVIIHNEYIEGDVWSRDKVNTGDWSIWYRIKGESANEPNFMFMYSATKPILPSATASIEDMIKAGWSDVPPSTRPEGYNLYQVYAKFNEYGNIIASWSEPYSPDGKDGINGESILVQYATAQNSNDWHFPFRDGDEWERQSIDGGKTWTIPFRCVGETGGDGAYVENQYIQHDSWTTPPSQSASGWQDTPFTDIESGKFIWKRERKVVPPTPAGSWGAPYVVSGQKGQDGTNGKDGLNGANGVDGNDGTSIIFKGAYSSHPKNPKDGWCYYNTVDKKSYVYQSGAWYQMTVDGIDGINGTNGADGLSIEYKGEMKNPPANPKKNWSYRDTDNGMVYIYNGYAWVLMVADGTDGSNGLNGKDGLSVFITYNDNAINNKPSKPTGNGTTGGWHTAPGANCVWMSQKVAASSTEGAWGEPIQIKGADGTNGESVTPKGEWVNNMAYNKGDIVKHNGYSYIAISNAPAGNAPDASIYSDIYIKDNQVTINNGNALRVMRKGSDYWLIMTDYVDPIIIYTLESSVATVVFNSLGNPTPTAYSVVLKKTVDGINAASDKLWLVTRYFDGSGWRRHGNAQLATSTSVTVRADAQQYETRVYAAQFDAEDWKDNYLSKSSVARADSGKDGINGQDGTNGTDGDNGLTPEIRNGYWWIGSTNTGIKAEGVDGTNGITPHIGSNGNWWIGNQDTGIPATGSQGDKGPTGSMPRPCGFFTQGTTYMWDAKFQDWVIHPVGGINYQFMVRTFGATVTAAPTSAQGDSNWEVADKTKFVATDTALIDKANIAGFIYYNDYMISQWGKLNGVNRHVSELTTSADWAAFVPNIKLDGKKGEVIGAGGKFSVDQNGDITAKSGAFGFMSILEDSIKSTNIELTNRALPSLEDMSHATDTPPKTTSSNVGSGNINVEVSTNIANIKLSKPQVISLVANGECRSGDRHYDAIFGFAQVSVTDSQGINMGSQTVAHGATSEENDFSRVVSFTLPTGTYTVNLTGNSYIKQTDKPVSVTAKMTITNLRIEAISSTTMIGNNGFASHFASDKYVYFNSQEKIEFRFRNYGFQISETGLRKMTDGNNWIPL